MRKSTALAASIATVAGIAIGITGTLAVTAEPVSRTAHAPATVNACSHEGDTSCYWDAETQGNGEGHSYYADARGNVYYDTTPYCLDMAANILGAYSVTLTAWENGTAYSDTFRTDNVDVYADQLSANCQ